MKDAKFIVSKDDLKITWFSGKGGGGQHRNKHSNCCRIQHPDSGVLVTGQSHKERKSNMREALENLVAHNTFRFFCEQGLIEIEEGIKLQEKIEQKVNEWLSEDNFIELNDKDFKLLTKGKNHEVIDGCDVWTP